MSQQSSPTPGPVAWMVLGADGRIHFSLGSTRPPLVDGDEAMPLSIAANPVCHTNTPPSSALPATTPSDTPLPKWWEAAVFVGPFTPTGEGGNDGFVRDAHGDMVANCFGFEARADVIAALLNSVGVSPSEGSAPDTHYCVECGPSVRFTSASAMHFDMYDHTAHLIVPPNAPDTATDDDRAVDRFVARVLADPFCASVTEHALVLEVKALRDRIEDLGHELDIEQGERKLAEALLRRVPPSAPDTKPDERLADDLFRVLRVARHWAENEMQDEGDAAELLAACDRLSSSPPEGEDTQRLEDQ